MARKKLFGNVSEPRCETCQHGKLSSDGDSILCQRGGVLPLSHHCRHFQYDPLRRTPRRVRPLEEFDAAEFALDDLSAEWLEAATQEEPSPDDVKHAQLMKKLRAYLNETSAPNVDDILVLLNETPIAPEDTETLLAEADALMNQTTAHAPAAPTAKPAVAKAVVSDAVIADILAAEEPSLAVVDESAVIDDLLPEDEVDEDVFIEDDLEEIGTDALLQEADDLFTEDSVNVEETDEAPAADDEEPVAPAEEAEKATPSAWHADSSLDISGDLERLTVDVVQSSISSAFRNFDLKLGNDAPQEERDDIALAQAGSDGTLLTMPTESDSDDDDHSLRAEDLIFLSEMQIMDDDNDSIAMNADGTFRHYKGN